jgi:hypothetical protein
MELYSKKSLRRTDLSVALANEDKVLRIYRPLPEKEDLLNIMI